MFQEEINHAVKDISYLQDMETADLKLLIERYPYCQVVHVLYSKKLHEDHSPSFEKQLQRTAAIVYDRNVLQQVIEKTPLQKPIPAGFEQEEEILPVKEVTKEIQEEIKQEVPEKAELPENVQTEEPVVMIDEHVSDQVFETIISDQESEKIEEEVIEPVDEIQTPQTIAPEFIETREELKEELILPPLESIEQTEQETDQNHPDTDEIIHEEFELADLKQSDEPLMHEELVEEKQTLSEDSELDEPVFEMPGYNIERELGKLDEKDEIRIQIRKQEEEEKEVVIKPEEQLAPVSTVEEQSHSFSDWLKIVAGESKARVVELKREQMPLMIHTQDQSTTHVAETAEEENPELKVITEDIAGELARKSLEPDDRLVSETYARILYMQGKYAKAIEMYEKLSLKKPAKSDYFAALIEQIKKRK